MSQPEENNQQKKDNQEQQAQVNTLQGGNLPPKDNTGNENISRGIIGLKSNPIQASYITPGTVADLVNGPSRTPNEQGKVNPVTEKDLEERIKLERSKAGMDKDRQEQIAIKIRTEMQGFRYTPPEDFKDDPELSATPDYSQEKEPEIKEENKEKVIDVK